MEPAPSVAIVGDSYIRRFEAYALQNLIYHLDLRPTHVAYFGLGGAAAYKGEKLITDKLQQAMALPQVDQILLLIGSNDLCHMDLSPAILATQIFYLADYALRGSHASSISICSVIPRLNQPDPMYNQRVDSLNDALYHLCKADTHIEFCRLRGLRQNVSPTYYNPKDNIHLNNDGNYKLYRSLRGAVHRSRVSRARACFPTCCPVGL